jgi:hypothetical protein
MGTSCDDLRVMKRGAAILFCIGMAHGQPQKWPATLQADIAAGSWAAAERVGEALIEEIDAGRMFATFGEVAEEAKSRALYADALEHIGKPETARAQRCLARAVADAHPDAECLAQARRERERRVVNLKSEVLATQVRIPASFPFAHPGMVTVIAFSAVWCAPCVKELDELRHVRNPQAQVVMLDVDQLTTDEKAAFVPTQTLLGPEVPRLYVLDRRGNVRFHVAGFEDDGFFAQKLDWMIAAAGQE